jgi:hypothetical protein
MNAYYESDSIRVKINGTENALSLGQAVYLSQRLTEAIGNATSEMAMAAMDVIEFTDDHEFSGGPEWIKLRDKLDRKFSKTFDV